MAQREGMKIKHSPISGTFLSYKEQQHSRRCNERRYITTPAPLNPGSKRDFDTVVTIISTLSNTEQQPIPSRGTILVEILPGWSVEPMAPSM